MRNIHFSKNHISTQNSIRTFLEQKYTFRHLPHCINNPLQSSIDFIQNVHVDWVKPNTCNMASCFIGGDTTFFVVVVDVADDGFVVVLVVRVGEVTAFAMVGVVCCACIYRCDVRSNKSHQITPRAAAPSTSKRTDDSRW